GVESTDLTPADFVDVVKETKRAMGESLDQIISEGNDILRDKLKDLDVGEVSVSAPKNLGTVFDKPDNYGTILVCRVQGGGRDMTVAIGIGFIRVKNRLIFMYLYEEYKNEDSILRLKRSLEAWTDATLAANK
ncbi:MAG TPA: hypothetical protein PKI32_07410, partial [Opitutales bacterium]|nr:hypothetical protein [Opitutales bacterium]